jgi:RNA polymerase sigma factor
VKNVLTFSIPSIPDDTVESRVTKARNGDSQAREELIRDYIPFILKTASGAVKRYVAMGSDEAACTALSAFNEAIDAYNSTKPGFLPFAATVIRRRLIDLFRKENRHTDIPFSALGTYTGYSTERLDSISVKNYDLQDWQIAVERRDEIEQWKRVMEEFGINITAVAKKAPKHRDARKKALIIAGFLANHHTLRRTLWAERKLPVDDLYVSLPESIAVSKKTLQRNETYITAVSVILSGNFPSLKEFIDELL